MRQPCGKHQLDQLVGQRPRVDHRHRQPVAEIRVGLVHRRRSETDHVSASLDEPRPGVEHLWEDLFAFVTNQPAEVGLGVEVLHPGAVLGQLPVGQGLAHPGEGRAPLGDHPERTAKRESKQQGSPPGSDDGDIQH